MPQVIIKNQTLEREIETVVNWFYKKHPNDALFMEEMVKRESAHLHQQNGMSKDGCFLTYGKLPSQVYSIVKQAFRRVHNIEDFWSDYDRYQLFFKVWRNAAIKRRPTAFLDLGALNKPTT